MSMGHADALLAAAKRARTAPALSQVYVRDFIPRVPAALVARDGNEAWVRWPNGVTVIVPADHLEPVRADIPEGIAL